MSKSDIIIYDSRGQHFPTAESRKQVIEAIACGLDPEDIAFAMGISPYEVDLHYREEITRGPRLVSAEVASTVLKNARAGDSSSQQFWLKARAGWNPAAKVEVTGKDGGPIQMEERKKAIDTVTTLMMKSFDPRKNDPVGVKK